MILRPPRSTRTDTLFPYTTLFRSVAALTGGKTRFDVKLVQMVRLLKNGEPFKMSKRAGNFVTLADVVDEVGKDAVRFTMLTRKADARSEERRVGKECVRTCRSRGSAYH